MREAFLLQRRGDERRRRIALDRFALDTVDLELACADRSNGAVGIGLVLERELVDLLAVEIVRRAEKAPASALRSASMDQYSSDLKASISCSRSTTSEAQPIARGPRSARPGSLRQRTGDKREPDEIVERAAREIGIDEFFVDLARMLDGFEQRIPSSRVEHDPFDGFALQRILLVEDLQHVPRDRLALAIGVGGEDQLVGFLQRVGDVLDALLGAVIDFQIMEKSSSGFTEPSLDGSRDVAEAGHHLIFGAPDIC